jgi:Xaa-Pro aminopeptidase
VNQPPFAADHLDALLRDAGLDLLLVTGRANVRYLTGGHVNHAYARSADHGDTRHVPLLGVPAGGLDRAFHVGRGDGPQLEAMGSWVADRVETALGGEAAAAGAAERVRQLGLERARIGLELAHLPADAWLGLRSALPYAHFQDATPLLLELRAVKRPDELEHLAAAGRLTAGAIDAVLGAAAARSATTVWAHRAVATEVESRGGVFAFAFLSVGAEPPRYPRERAWGAGELLQIDAGCEVAGYRSDVCRMGARGEPSSLARELYDQCLAVQARIAACARPGVRRGELLAAGREAVAEQRHARYGRSVLHGMGLGHHEQPEFAQPERLLEAGNVVSVEAEFVHPDTGSVKVEDAIAITANGCLVLGSPFGGIRVHG